jgi:hypothetical protein
MKAPGAQVPEQNPDRETINDDARGDRPPRDWAPANFSVLLAWILLIEILSSGVAMGAA